VITGTRHRAREAALQILYFWEVGGVDPAAAAARYWSVVADDVEPLSDASRAFAERLAAGTIAHVAELDPVIESHAQNWRLIRMAVIDRLILRLAAYELLHEPETPPGVVIDEALELARTFSEADAVRFVNGILDAIHKHRHD
jgi:transcription antitermination protein NusB